MSCTGKYIHLERNPVMIRASLANPFLSGLRCRTYDPGCFRDHMIAASLKVAHDSLHHTVAGHRYQIVSAII